MKYYSIAIMLKDYSIITGKKLHKDREEVEILQDILLKELKGNCRAIGIIEEERPN